MMGMEENVEVGSLSLEVEDNFMETQTLKGVFKGFPIRHHLGFKSLNLTKGLSHLI